MPKPDETGTDRAAGQEKMHTVRDADGNVVPSPSGNEEWSQEEWRSRDKAAGYTRAGATDDEGDEGE